MKLSKHIGYVFYKSKPFRDEILKTHKANYEARTNDESFNAIKALYQIMHEKPMAETAFLEAENLLHCDCKPYYVTESIYNKLELLKITKYDWSIFAGIENFNAVYFLPDNTLVKVTKDKDKVYLFNLFHEKIGIQDKIDFDMGWKSLVSGGESGDYYLKDEIEKMIFHLLCFIHFTDNEEVIVKAGTKHGNWKTGTTQNDTSFHVTMINSRWRQTVIRNEEFMVRGHFRLQKVGVGRTRTELKWIDPFKKDGYKRTYGE